jgi:hypothetical protein
LDTALDSLPLGLWLPPAAVDSATIESCSLRIKASDAAAAADAVDASAFISLSASLSACA